MRPFYRLDGENHLSRIIALIALGAALLTPYDLVSQPPSQPAQDLVKDVAYNELQDRVQESFWEYRIDKRVDRHTLTEERVETRYGRLTRLIAKDGLPLSKAEQQQEDARLQSLLHNPGELQKAKEQFEKDDRRLKRLYAILPTAFLCDYDGEDGGNIRLRFRPNPAFKAPTYEARIFHALGGQIWIDPRQKRLVAIKSELIERVTFAYGLLGYVNKGGSFAIHRRQVSPAHWRTDLIDLQASGRLLLFKNVSREQHEARSRFEAVPGNTTLEQAEALLKQSAVMADPEHD